MKGVSLYDYQIDAVERMRNGCILCGAVGSGKSRTALAYYYILCGGQVNTDRYIRMDDSKIKDLYIITTARKRDTLEWEEELLPFRMTKQKEIAIYDQEIIIDSWNNISKYTEVSDAFFIFDEQRVVGSGAWVKAFYKIAKKNNWILLSATPGDTWMDYIPVFVANGFYKNKTEFIREHVVYKRTLRYPIVDRYLNTGRLMRLRNKILVDMAFHRDTTSHEETVYCTYDKMLYRHICKDRWNIYEDKPITNAGELCLTLRRLVNTDESRSLALLEIFEKHPRLIIFYQFDYELDILRNIHFGADVESAEWNGHKHQDIPNSDRWVYFVQYTAGAEGWNCVKTDTMVFYSLNYSYKVMQQSKGRIDRLNTPYKDLYYYILRSKSGIDLSINKALVNKKKFNESRFAKHILEV